MPRDVQLSFKVSPDEAIILTAFYDMLIARLPDANHVPDSRTLKTLPAVLENLGASCEAYPNHVHSKFTEREARRLIREARRTAWGLVRTLKITEPEDRAEGKSAEPARK